MITKTAEGRRKQECTLETSGDSLDERHDLEMQLQMVRPHIELTTKRLRNTSRDCVYQWRERFSTTDSVNPGSPEFGKVEYAMNVGTPDQAGFVHSSIEPRLFPSPRLSSPTGDRREHENRTVFHVESSAPYE